MKELLRFLRNSASSSESQRLEALRAFSKWLLKARGDPALVEADRPSERRQVLSNDAYPGAMAAINPFLADKPEKIASLPASGGFFVKGCTTGIPASPIKGLA